MIGSQLVCGLATEEDRTFQWAEMELSFVVYLAELVDTHTSVFPFRVALHPGPSLSINFGITLASLLISNNVGPGGTLYLQMCSFII